MERIGSWIQTYASVEFYPLDARPEEINIGDIAHSLSMQCRFNGHCLKFYSVAEHSCFVSDFASEENKLGALLHDAAEAYLSDMPKPLKPFMQTYLEAEKKLEEKICERFGLKEIMNAEIKALDTAILFAEAAQNMGPPPKEWEFKVDPLPVTLQYWTPERAQQEFMNRYWRLTEK
jgi:hypothetical protein